MTIRNISAPPSLKYDCKQYRGTAEELFQRYLDLGFIYPEKRKRLEPVWDSVLETWQRILDLPSELSLVVEHGNPESGAWTTMHIWKHTKETWQVQHLASGGGAFGSRAVLLSLQELVDREPGNEVVQNWFSPGNRYANRIFGSVDELGESHARVEDHAYFRVELSGASAPALHVEQIHASEPSLVQLARLVRSDLYVRGEGLENFDLGLSGLDEEYRAHGLSRTRQVFVVRDKDEILGAALVYRASLGFNLSLLENRCELLVKPDMEESIAARVTRSLIDRAREEYGNFEPGFMPLAAPVALEDLVVAQGARLMRRYRQGTWSRDVYQENAARMGRFFDRITRRSASN